MDIRAVAGDRDAGQDGIGVVVRAVCDENLQAHGQAAHHDLAYGPFPRARIARALPDAVPHTGQPRRPSLDISEEIINDLRRRGASLLESTRSARLEAM